MHAENDSANDDMSCLRRDSSVSNQEECQRQKSVCLVIKALSVAASLQFVDKFLFLKVYVEYLCIYLGDMRAYYTFIYYV